MECPACHSEAPHPRDPKPIVTPVDSYAMWTCAVCATQFAMPRNPAPGEWYADTREWYGWRWEFDECLAEMKHVLPPAGKILEIGCGEGGVLQRASELGFKVIGNDINSAALR